PALASASQPKKSAPALKEVTPVSGPSWLEHLGLSRAGTAIGQMGTTGAVRTSAKSFPWGQSSNRETLEKPFKLTGADLYRISCESCHNVEGVGTPPEIRSLIDSVRATSAESMKAQMARAGVKMSDAEIK